MNNKDKVSLITILLNEESSVDELIAGILCQSQQPDEIVFVDGGSTDKTVELVNSHIVKGAPIKLIVVPGTNSAQAENIAIRNTANEIIAITDAGCRADKNWLSRLISYFSDNVDIVSGVYLPDSRTVFEEALADVIFPNLNMITENNFSPSNRSIAFKKSVWRSIGGYPEGLRRSDDTWFMKNAMERNMNFALAKDAIVFWRPRQNLIQLFKYAYLDERSSFLHGVFWKCDMKPYYMHTIKLALLYLTPLVLLLFGSSFLFIFWGILLLLYLAVKTVKHIFLSDKKSTIKILLYPIIIFTIDIASFLGMCSGLIGRLINKIFLREIIKD